MNIYFRKMITSLSYLPLFLKGEVVKGFGRGSKDLGCPTANYAKEVIQSLPKDMKPGVYYGWAKVDDEPVCKMVANVGWCPYYQNKELSVETHILCQFDNDFYGSTLKICITGYLREEKNFDSIDALKEQIKQDIKDAEKNLDKEDFVKMKIHAYFTN